MATEKTAKKKRKLNTRRLLRLLAAAFGLLLLIAALLLLISWLIKRKSFTRAELETSFEAGSSQGVSFTVFGDKLLRYSADGLSLMDGSGKELWNASVVMTKPRLLLQGSYGVLADIGGKTAYIFGEDGVSGEVRLNDPILTLALSSHGVLALAQDRKADSFISFFDKKGKALDISLNLNMSLSGYPMDMALSPEGTGLVISTVTTSSGQLDSQLVFYNFSVGKGESNRLVGYYSYDNSLFPEVKYLTDRSVVAVGDERMLFLDLTREDKPVVAKEVVYDGQLTTVKIKDGKVLTLVSRQAGGGMTLTLYGSDGAALSSHAVEDRLISLDCKAGMVAAVTEKGVTLWDSKGRERFNGELEGGDSQVLILGEKTLLQPDGTLIKRYQLK